MDASENLRGPSIGYQPTHSGPDRLENRFLFDAVSILDDFDGIGVFWSPEFEIDVAVALGQPSQSGSVT